MIQTCFLKEPNQRPDFKEIKETLHVEYKALLATAQSDANTNLNEGENPYVSMIPINKIMDNKMKDRYLDMQMGNKEHNYTNIDEMGDEKLIEQNQRLSATKYISLEHITELDTNPDFLLDCRSASVSLLTGEYSDDKKFSPDSRAYKYVPSASKSLRTFDGYSEGSNAGVKYSELNWGSALL